MIDKYFSRFDPNKNYKRLLFRAGKGLQSAELNELQETINHELTTIAGTIFGDGSLLSGGELTMDRFTCHIKESTVYVRGLTHKVSSAQIEVPQQGGSIIGLALKDSYITELEDPTLRDPAVGTRNYNESGAGRLQVTARWCLDTQKLDNEQFFPVYNFTDGVLQTIKKVAPELEGARNMIARYDNASSGSYVITGMELSYVADDNEHSNHLFSVSAGQCHVEGYEVEFQYAKNLTIPFSTDVRSIEAEPHTFDGDKNYKLRKDPIARITRILGIKKIDSQVTHGNFTGAKDTLPKSPVVRVIRVYQNGTTYNENSDYKVVGDQIDWTPGGQEPAPGSTYNVEYQYTTIDVSNSIQDNGASLNVTGLDNNTLFYVSYQYYLPRIDRVLLTKEGTFKILTGIPDDVNPKAPPHTNLLSLGTVKLIKGKTPEVTLDFFRAFKMSDIQRLFNELEGVKYNIARLSLAEDINRTDPSSVKKNTFVDPFFDDSQRDFGKSQNAFITDKILKPNVKWEIKQIKSDPDIVLPFSEKSEIENTAESKSRKVNEFVFLGAPDAEITLSPSEYKWVETVTQRTISGSSNQTLTNTFNLGRAAIIPRINISVNAGLFNQNEQVDLFFDGKLVTTLQANSEGYLVNQTFQIPANVISGSKSVRLEGKVSKVQGIVTFTATPLITEHVRVIAPPRRSRGEGGGRERSGRNSDPVAQTFTPTEDFFLSSVEIKVTTLPEKYVDVSLCRTIAGLPDKSRIIDSVRLNTNQITVNEWTKFRFNTPILVSQDTEYAIIVSTLDAVTEVACSELGAYDKANGRFITNQSYAIGVLLNSSNMSTWTPIQKEDLTFKLNKAVFESETEILTQKVSFTEKKTDLMLLADNIIYPDTQVSFEATLTPTSGGKSEVMVISPLTPIQIPEFEGDIQVKMKLLSVNPQVSPIVIGSIQLAAGVVQLPADYITREFPVNGNTIKVYVELNEPNTSTVSIFYESASNVWTPLEKQLSTATPVGDGFIDIEFKKTSISVDKTRIKISMNTTDKTLRPEVKNLRAYII